MAGTENETVDDLILRIKTAADFGHWKTKTVMRLVAEIARLRDRTRWHDMGESIPEGVDWVLARFRSGVNVCPSWKAGEFGSFYPAWAYLPEDAQAEPPVEPSISAEDVAQFRASNAFVKHAHNTPEPTSPWQPIETAPRDGSLVLLLVDHQTFWLIGCWGTDVAAAGSESTWWFQWDGTIVPGEWGEPTHWMPLPPPPTKPEPSDADVLCEIASDNMMDRYTASELRRTIVAGLVLASITVIAERLSKMEAGK